MVVGLPNGVLIDLEVQPSEKAFDELEEVLNKVFEEEGIDYRLPKDIDKLREFENFDQAWVAFEESWEGDNPREAELTGWWDEYEGELSEEDKEKINKAIEKSKTLKDFLDELSKELEEYPALVYDEYYEDFQYFVKRLIEEIKSKK